MTTEAARHHGPSALGGSVVRFVELTLTLARTEFKLRYFGSVLGYFWSLARPLLFFGVLYVFFVKILGLSKGLPHYGVYLLEGIVLWTYFAEATGNCVACLVARESLLRKVRFPRMVIPLSVSLTATFNLAMNFIAIIVFAVINGVDPTWRWLEVLPIVAGFVVLATGVGMILSAMYVRFRDVQPIWDVVSQAWFYGSPIMYAASVYAKHGIEHIAMLNPIATLLTEMAHVFIGGPYPVPSASGTVPFTFPSAIGAAGTLTVAIAIAIIFGVFALGWFIFTREAPRVAENL
jgi:ABC-2 type transport system permease protein